MERIYASSGKYFSNAAFSGAFTDVWPATIAFNFVADESPICLDPSLSRQDRRLTRTIFSNDTFYELCFD
jgi:hypothetical protein